MSWFFSKSEAQPSPSHGSNDSDSSDKWGKNQIPDDVRHVDNVRAAEILQKQDIDIHGSEVKKAERVAEVFGILDTAGSPMGKDRPELTDQVMDTMFNGFAKDANELKDNVQGKHEEMQQILENLPDMDNKELEQRINATELKDNAKTFDANDDSRWRSDDSSSSSSSSGSGGNCFLTTACTAARGLPDDCAELTALRAFRDGYLRRQPEGPALIEEYYRIAPAIVAGVEASSDRGRVLEDIYAVVTRCVRAIGAGREQEALDAYRAMVRDLGARYRD